jgi:type I restriction enzyme S subunit
MSKKDKTKFKEIEAEDVPEGWSIVTIGQLGTVVTGKTPSKDHPEDWGDVLDFITPTDITSSQKFPNYISRKISLVGVERFKRMILPPNSIIVTCIGSDMGKVVMNERRALTNQQINSIIVNNDNDANFVFYLLKYLYPKLWEIAGGGSTMPIVNKTAFESIKVSIPKSKEEQKQIAGILSSIDDKINNNHKIKLNLENLTIQIFKNWFINLENELPDTWISGTLGDIALEINNKVRDKLDNISVLSAVSSGNLVKSEDYFNKQVFSNSLEKYKKVEKFDFAYNPSRINIGSIGMLEEDIIGAVSPIYIVFRPKKEYHYFIQNSVRLGYVKSYIEQFSSGSVRQALNFSDFSSIPINIPPIEVVKKFNDFVSEIKIACNKINKEEEMLNNLRDSILPKLLSGKIRV